MKTLKALSIGILLFALPLFFFAQGGPPNPPNDHNEDGNQGSGNSAPIASGLTILLTLGVAYGGRKTYQLYKERQEEG